MGGIFNPFNLGLYGYSHLNPVKFFDPDGKTVYHVNKLGIKDAVVTPGDYSKYKGLSVFENGIMSGREGNPKDAVETGVKQIGEGQEFLLVHNESNGFIGYLMECAYQKVRGIPIIGKFLPKTHEEKELAGVIRGVRPKSVTAHSQGTIILTRVLESLGKGLNGTDFTLNGAAVSEGVAGRAIDRAGVNFAAYNAYYLDPVNALFGTSLLDKAQSQIRTIVYTVVFFDLEKTHSSYEKQ
ncbi:hypothetical protein GKODMF_00760 [Candidatus Electrothrix gigas]